MEKTNQREEPPAETFPLIKVIDNPHTEVLGIIKKNDLENVQNKEIIIYENTNEFKLNGYEEFFFKFHNRYYNNPGVQRFFSSGEVMGTFLSK